jgi:hypothetical protein
MKMAVVWVVAACSVLIALMMEAAGTAETSVNYQTTRRKNLKDSQTFSPHHLAHKYWWFRNNMFIWSWLHVTILCAPLPPKKD